MTHGTETNNSPPHICKKNKTGAAHNVRYVRNTARYFKVQRQLVTFQLFHYNARNRSLPKADKLYRFHFQLLQLSKVSLAMQLCLVNINRRKFPKLPNLGTPYIKMRINS